MFFGDFFNPKPNKKRVPVKNSTKIDLMAKSGGKCSKCRCSLVGITPHVHHKDGKRYNNDDSNLIILCPNCHSATHKKMQKKKNQTNNNNNDIKPGFIDWNWRTPIF